MFRKLFIWGLLLAIVAGIGYVYLFYAVVALYEPATPKVTYLIFVKKPERDTTFFYNHIEKSSFEKDVANYKRVYNAVPWHMDYDKLINGSIYMITMDNR